MNRPTTFREKKSFWKHDSVIRALNTARNALYRVGLDEMGHQCTREMHKRFSFLETYAVRPADK